MRLFAWLLVVPALGLAPAASATLEGSASVVDGDTLRIGAETVRLEGIDAPEARQRCRDGAGRGYRCGARASEALGMLVRRGVAACRGEERDRYGRLLAVCEVAGVELNAAMVRGGWALAFRRYSEAYVGVEGDAARAGRGLWSGRFEEPWAWRAANARPVIRSARPQPVLHTTAAAPCRIKGNVSASGRIYHLPGSRHYAETRIDAGRGERWFCSEAEARAAGWRAARG